MYLSTMSTRLTIGPPSPSAMAAVLNLRRLFNALPAKATVTHGA